MSLHCASHNHSESSDWRNRPWTGSQLSWWSRGWWLALHPAVCPSSSRAPDSGSRRGDTGGTSPVTRRPSAARLQQTFTSNICILYQKLLIEVLKFRLIGEWLDNWRGVTCQIGVVGGFDEVMREGLGHVVTLGQFVQLHHWRFRSHQIKHQTFWRNLTCSRRTLRSYSLMFSRDQNCFDIYLANLATYKIMLETR